MSESVFIAAGAAVFLIGLYGLFALPDLLRKIVAANIATGGVFLILLAAARTAEQQTADPVPQALVLTGIVISVSLTAFALSLLRRLVELTGSDRLDEGEGE